MADFSKQWCEENNLEISGDFDILEEANKLDNDSHINLMCEGFGFSAIYKNEKGNILLAFDNYQDGITEWKPYNKIIK
jgi:hypothetical protein